MTTQQEFYDQCMAENPTQIQTINGVEFVLTYEQCCESCTNWAIGQGESATNETPTS